MATLDSSWLDKDGASYVSKFSSFINNSAQINVAAVRFNSDNNKIYNSIFINNSCPASSGALVTTYLNSIVSNCTFINNYAQTGAAISCPSTNRDINQLHLTITDCTFINNNATRGGAINVASSKDIISNSIFTIFHRDSLSFVFFPCVLPCTSAILKKTGKQREIRRFPANSIDNAAIFTAGGRQVWTFRCSIRRFRSGWKRVIKIFYPLRGSETRATRTWSR